MVIALSAGACVEDFERNATPLLPEVRGECPQFVTGTQTIAGLEASMLAGSPTGNGALLVHWHGTGGTASEDLMLFPDAVRDEILGEGGIIIAPQSNGEDRGGYTPNGVWYEGGDYEWVDQVVACAVRDHGIDPRKIYTNGCSAGGLMAGSLAVDRSEYIAAATPNSGGILFGGVGRLQDRTRIPAVMTMHGGSEDVVRVEFEETSASLDELITRAGGFAVDCNHGMGHCGADGMLRYSAWAFMKAHPFGRWPSPFENGLPSSFPSYCSVW